MRLFAALLLLSLGTTVAAVNASNATVELYYLSHVAVIGVRSNTSVDPVNGTVTTVSPSTNNTIDDPDVASFVNTTEYERARNTTYKFLQCSYGNVVEGSESACHNSIVLESETKREAVNTLERVVMKVTQAMYLGNGTGRRRLITRRDLGGSDWDELNAVFRGVVMKIPDQSMEKSIWPSTLKVFMKTIRCGQIGIGNIDIQSTASSNNAVNANVKLQSLDILCSAEYTYKYGWFGGSGRVSAGGTEQSIDTTITLNEDGTASINSCSSNVDLSQLSFSGGIVSKIADTFKGMFRSKLESTLGTTICDELGPLGSTFITSLAKTVRNETHPYVPVANGGSYVDVSEGPMLKENTLAKEVKAALISWKSALISPNSTDPLALLVPQAFSAVNEYFSNKETGINHFLRKYVLEDDGTLVLDFTTTESERGFIMYDGVDPLTSTSLGMSRVVVTGLDQFQTFRPLVVLGDQTLGHELRMEGRVTASASLSLTIGPSTAPGSMIDEHNGNTVRENPQLSLSISDLYLDAATFVGVSKEKALSVKVGSIQQAALPCLSSTFHEMEVRKFISTIRDIEEPLFSGFISVGIDRLFSQALHLVYLKFEDRMKLAMPNYLTTAGSEMMNELIDDYVASHNQTHEKTCPAPALPYKSGEYINFRTNDLWNQFQSAALGPFVENNASMLNKLISDMTDAGSVHNLLGENLTEKNKTRVQTGSGFLGDLELQAGNIGIHGLNTIHGIEMLTAKSQHHGTNFAGVDSWLPVEHNMSKHLLSTAMSVGTNDRPLEGSIDVYFAADGAKGNGYSPILNDFTFSVGISELQVLIQMLIKLDLGNLKHLQLRHVVHLDCWVSAIGELGFHQAHAKFFGSLFASIKCRTCTSPGFRELEKTLSTEQATKDLTEIANRVFDFVGKMVESNNVKTEINKWISDATTRCAIEADGYFPDGSYQDTEKIKLGAEGVPPVVVVQKDSDATLDYMLFAIVGALVGGMLMCCRFYGKERRWQRDLLSLEKEIEEKNKGRPEGEKLPSPLISATTSLFSSPHVPILIRIGVPIVLLANAVFFLSGHLSLGALVRVYLNVAGEDVLIPDVFTFSMAQSTIDMWNANAKFLAIIIVIFSGMWPYTKISISMFLWMAPPTWYAPSSREAAFMCLDGLGKWSIIDIFVLVLSMVGFHLIINSPEVSFLPPDFWKVEVSVVPVWGLYANLIAQVQSQIISHICIYCHRNSIAAAEEEMGHRLIDIGSVKKLLEERKVEIKIHSNPVASREKGLGDLPTLVEVPEESSGESSKMESFDGITRAAEKAQKKTAATRTRARSTWLTSQNNIPGPRKALLHKKASLRSHYFEMKSDEGEAGEIGRLRIQVSPCGQWLVIFGIIFTELILVVGTITPSFYMNTKGLAGLAIDLGKTNTSNKQYSILSTVESIGNQIDPDETISVIGIGSIAGFFLLTTVIIPNLQLLGLFLMWTLKLSLQNQKKLFLINEALSAWQYLEVYIIAIGVASLQMADISGQIARPLCRNLDETFDMLATYGVVDRINANCFTVLSGVEDGMQILLVGAVLLNIFNMLVNRATVAALQDREARLRGDVLEGNAERPKSFFRDSCIKYLLFSCCCCVRYVAEEHDDKNEDESDTASLSTTGGTTRKRTVTLSGTRKRVMTWGSARPSRTMSVVSVFVPEEKNGLPPHWEEVTSEGGDVYYWHSLTGETQWENPTNNRRGSSLSRVELVDEATGKVYFWNQQTGSTRWKPDQEDAVSAPEQLLEELVDEKSGQTYYWNKATGSTKWKEGKKSASL